MINTEQDMPTSDSPSDFQIFHNRLRILLNIEFHGELDDILEGDEAQWRFFRTNPWRWMITAPTHQAERIFQMMLDREAGRRPKL